MNRKPAPVDLAREQIPNHVFAIPNCKASFCLSTLKPHGTLILQRHLVAWWHWQNVLMLVVSTAVASSNKSCSHAAMRFLILRGSGERRLFFPFNRRPPLSLKNLIFQHVRRKMATSFSSAWFVSAIWWIWRSGRWWGDLCLLCCSSRTTFRRFRFRWRCWSLDMACCQFVTKWERVKCWSKQEDWRSRCRWQ